MLESTEYATIKLLGFVKSMHAIPRSGHSKNVGDFFAKEGGLRRDYFLGLTMVFTMIMGIAAVWYMGLLILRILGHRVGCAAGRPATIPAEPMENGKESVNTDETGEFIVMQADQNRVNRTRICFFIAVLYAIAASGILMWSLVSAQGALQDFYENVEDVKDGFVQMPTSLDTAIQASTDLEAIKDELVDDLSQFCPTPNGSVGGLDLSDQTQKVITSLQAIPDMSDDASWDTFNATLSEMNEALVDAVSFIGFLKSPKEWWFIIALCAAGCIVFCTLFLLAYVWKAGKEGYEFSGETENSSKLLHFLVIPFFSLLVSGTWFLTAVAFTSGAANADFCYGEITTGDTVLSFLRHLEFEETSAFYLRADDYLHGCVDGVSATMPSSDDFNTFITEAQSNLAVFTSLDVGDLEDACPGDDVTATIAEVESFSVELDSLIADFNGVYDHMSCESIAPLVQKTVYEVSCNSMSEGFLWTFASGLCLAVCGTILISLRSATLRPQIYLVSANKGEVADDDSYIVDSDDGDSRY